MPASNYPNGFAAGVTIRGVPLLQTHPGQVFWVYNGTALLPGQRGGSDGNKGTFDAPFATIDYAIGQCTADRGDIIFVKAGHSETMTAAAGIDADVAGIAIIGLGSGRNRPTINFTTATTADIDIDAANITIKNFYFDVTGIDAVIGALDVNAADFTLEGCEVLMADSGGQATEFIVTATAADRMAVLNNVIRSPNAGANNAVSIEGTPDGIVIAGNRIYGDFADACIHNPTGNVATNLVIDGNYLQNDQTTGHAIELVSACTGSISRNQLVTDAIATAVDQGSCVAFDNLYYDSSDVDAGATPFPITTTTGGVSIENVQDALYGADGIVTWPAAAAPANGVSIAEAMRWLDDAVQGANGVVTFPSGAAAANGVSIAEVLRYIQDQVINGTGTVLDTNTSLYGVLAGATGIPTFPSGAAAANGVSLAEVLRYIQDQIINGTGTVLDTNTSLYGVLAGATGIPTYPAAAAPANGVSLAEVEREIFDQADKAVTNTTGTLVSGTTIFTIAGGPIEILSLTARCVTGNDGTASTLQWSADPTDGAAATFSAASASLANLTAGAMVVLQGTTLATAPIVNSTGVGLGQQVTNGIVVGAGIITTTVGVGSTTGTWQHHLRYRPLSRGVTVS